MNKHCLPCGNVFTTSDKRSIYCSRRCFFKSLRKDKICQMCKKVFKQRGHGKYFCSRKCFGLWKSINILQEKAPNWKGGVTYTNGYRYILLPDHPKSIKTGYLMEHRFIVEKEIKRYLNKNEVIHHRDGNKLNNKIENLELMTRGEHMDHHRKDFYK